MNIVIVKSRVEPDRVFFSILPDVFQMKLPEPDILHFPDCGIFVQIWSATANHIMSKPEKNIELDLEINQKYFSSIIQHLSAGS